MITDYFAAVKGVIEQYVHILADFSSAEKAFSEEGEIIFSDNSRLEFAEVNDMACEGKIKYRYHYMDEAHSMIFRYDNAKHYPNLATFPHHKHTSDGVWESEEPTLADVLSEIERKITTKTRGNTED